MAVAIVSADGSILGVHPKPRPTMVIPAGGRMIPYDFPAADLELSNVVVVEPVPPNDNRVTFVVTDKHPDVVNAVVKDRLHKQIRDMEREAMMPRSVREFMLASVEKESKLPSVQLLATNAAYRKDKEFDEQIAALRAQMNQL